MAVERNGRKYADAKLVGDRGDVFLDSPDDSKSLDLAWSEGCPVGLDLVKPKSEGGRGATEMVYRYGQVIFWFKYLTNNLSDLGRGDLALLLTVPRRRIVGEDLGVHSEGWLPDESKDLVFRSATGYILPRLLVEFVGFDELNQGRNLCRVLEIFEELSLVVQDDVELLVLFADGLATDLKSRQMFDKTGLILKRLLGVGKLGEDNLRSEYDLILKRTRQTEILGSYYNSLSLDKLDELKIYRL